MLRSAILNKGAYYETFCNDSHNDHLTYKTDLTPYGINALIWWILVDLVGNSVQVRAMVEKIAVSRHSNSEVLLLKDIYVNGSYFRDHTFTKRTKRLNKLEEGDTFTATATLIEYHCSTSGKLDKLGLKSFRSVNIIENGIVP